MSTTTRIFDINAAQDHDYAVYATADGREVGAYLHTAPDGRLLDNWGSDKWRTGFICLTRPQFAGGQKVTKIGGRTGTVYTVIMSSASGSLILSFPVKVRAGRGMTRREIRVSALDAHKYVAVDS